MLLGVTSLYWFAALLTKWNVFMEHDPIESGPLSTLFTVWLLPRGVRADLPTAVAAVAGRGVCGGGRGDRTGRLPDRRRSVEPRVGEVDLRRRPPGLGSLAVSFPVTIVTRSPGSEVDGLPWHLAGGQGRAAAPGRPVLWAWTALLDVGGSFSALDEMGQVGCHGMETVRKARSARPACGPQAVRRRRA
jgi:hypothetical protein